MATPTGEPHEVALLSPGSKPVVSERVPQHVRVDVSDACLLGPAHEHELHAVLAEATFVGEPEPRLCRLVVRAAGSEVAVQCMNCPLADRDRPGAGTLAGDVEHSLVEVDV